LAQQEPVRASALPFKGEAARLRATGSRAAERPKQDAQGWVAWRGPDGRA